MADNSNGAPKAEKPKRWVVKTGVNSFGNIFKIYSDGSFSDKNGWSSDGAPQKSNYFNTGKGHAFYENKDQGFTFHENRNKGFRVYREKRSPDKAFRVNLTPEKDHPVNQVCQVNFKDMDVREMNGQER